MRLQGATMAPRVERGHDLYETPEEATLALLRVERLAGTIWEPCAGRGAIARVLRRHGHRVVCHDLVAYAGAPAWITPGRDFLAAVKRPRNVTAIVTNPPFMHADAFIRHGLELVPTVIVLLRAMAIEGARRADLIDRHLHRVWLGRERLPFMHRDGWQGPRQKGGGAPFAWFVFKRRPRPASSPIALRRMSWRGE